MNPKSNAAYDGHEEVVFVGDEALGYKGVIAIHSTALGPAAGGCRIWTYERDEDALTDVLRLSRGMTYKNAMAELPLGGGKAVLYKMGADRSACFEAFGRDVENLHGRYITAEDVGATVNDMKIDCAQHLVCDRDPEGGRPRRRRSFALDRARRSSSRSRACSGARCGRARSRCRAWARSAGIFASCSPRRAPNW